MSSVFVFLGPSLPLAEAQQVLQATYLPPAAMGDVYRLIDQAPAAIAIIDGVFERHPPVWHKEILHALGAGIPVFGAASMGALRAAEMDAFGMVGIGAIYEAFRAGALTRDDEVAVAHASVEHGYRPISEALVNIRDGLRRARRAGIVGEEQELELVAIAARRFYPERSWPTLLEDAQRAGHDADALAALRAFVRRERPNAKRDDALALLRHLAAERPARLPESSARPLQVAGLGSYILLEEHAGAFDSPWEEQRAALGTAAFTTYVSLTQPVAETLWRDALRLYCLAQEAWRRGLAPNALEALRAVSPRRIAGATESELRDDLHARIRDLEDALLASCRSEVSMLLRSALALQGRLLEVEAGCARSHAHPRAAPETPPVDRTTLWEWFVTRHPHARALSAPDLALQSGMRMDDLFTELQRLFLAGRSITPSVIAPAGAEHTAMPSSGRLDLARLAPISQGFGAIVEAEPGETLLDLGREAAALQSLLDQSGALLLRGFRLSPASFAAFGGAVMSRKLVYGGPREKVTDDDEVQLVEPGSDAFGLHCELAATPFRPDLCLFGCERPAARDGQTILADGVRLLAGLSEATRALFQSRRIKYVWRHGPTHWKRMFRVAEPEQLRAILGGIPGLTYEILPDGSIASEFVTDAIVTRCPSSRPAFANSLWTVGGFRPGQPFHSAFADGTPIPEDVRAEIRRVGAAITVPIEWRAHDVLVVDNWRVLHGRRAFDDTGRRIFAMFGARAHTPTP